MESNPSMSSAVFGPKVGDEDDIMRCGSKAVVEGSVLVTPGEVSSRSISIGLEYEHSNNTLDLNSSLRQDLKQVGNPLALELESAVHLQEEPNSKSSIDIGSAFQPSPVFLLNKSRSSAKKCESIKSSSGKGSGGHTKSLSDGPIPRVPSKSEVSSYLNDLQLSNARYTASTNRQYQYIFLWYKAIQCALILPSPQVISNVLSHDWSSDKYRVFVEIFQLGCFHFSAFLYFDLRKRLTHLRSALISLNLLLLASAIQWSSEAQNQVDLTETSLDDYLHQADIDHSAHIMMAYNILPPVLMNTVMIAYLIEERRNKIIFAATTVILAVGIVLYQVAPKLFQQRDSAVMMCTLAFFQFVVCTFFAKVMQQLDDEKFRFMLEQNQQNEQFKRIINAVDDAMIIISGKVTKEITFQNVSASSLFVDDLDEPLEPEQLLQLKQFYCFQKVRKDTDPFESVEHTVGISLDDLISKKFTASKYQIYTRHKDIGLCTSMAQAQLVTKLFEKKSREAHPTGFDFFMIKLIRLQKVSEEDTEKAIAIQLVDISEKIFNDCLSTESKYLTFINATISHEMRNPLNSMTAQLANQARIMNEILKVSRNDHKVKGFFKELKLSQDVTDQSARLLYFNVENIVSLPKLKEKTFQKNFAVHSIEPVVEEIKWITSWTARQRNIFVDSAFPGLLADEKQINFDKLRFQQVLLNYLSNAIKFIDKEAGRVKILVQLVSNNDCVRVSQASFEQEVLKFYGQNIIPKNKLPLVGASPHISATFSFEGNLNSIFSFNNNPKLVLSVFDNGVGIQEAAQKRLYELFSGLQQNKEVEAKGIGLGVVVSSLISQEFGGTSQVFSKPGHGSIFQSSFELPLASEESSNFTRYLKDGLPDPQEVKLLPPSQHLDFISFFLGMQSKLQLASCSRNINQGIRDSGQKRILIIDDEPYNCLALYTLLKSLSLKDVSFRVDLCMSGRNALKSVIKSIHPRGRVPKRSQIHSPGYSLMGEPVSEEVFENFRYSEDEALISEIQAAVAEDREVSEDSLLPKIDPNTENECEYSLILTDCSMPFMDGYECSKSIRKLLQASGITRLEDQPRIVAITGHFEPEYQMKAICSGMEQVFPKPMSQEVLSKLLLESGFEFHVSPSLLQCFSQDSVSNE